MRQPSIAFVFLLAALLAASCATAQSTPLIDIQKLMTAQEQKATGISSLSPVQLAALNGWLDRYSRRLLKVYKERNGGSAADAYTGVGAGHWIDKNGDGKIITLEDGSIWEIVSTDQVDTALWLPTTDITVIKQSGSLAAFKYILINTEDGEKASAKFLGVTP